MATRSEEFIYNWNNHLTAGTQRERQTVLVREAQTLRAAGYGREEAMDMLLADNTDMSATENAVGYVYADATTKEESTPSVAIVPTSYKEIQAQVENVLVQIGPNQFIGSLCDSEYPIVRTSRRGRESLVRLAESALTMRHAMQTLHESLAPYFETAMLDSIMLADKITTRIAEKGNGQFEIDTPGGKVNVDFNQAVSDSERFINGRFSEFGLACEYMVRVADYVSPHEKLRRAVNSK